MPARQTSPMPPSPIFRGGGTCQTRPGRPRRSEGARVPLVGAVPGQGLGTKRSMPRFGPDGFSGTSETSPVGDVRARSVTSGAVTASVTAGGDVGCGRLFVQAGPLPGRERLLPGTFVVKVSGSWPMKRSPWEPTLRFRRSRLTRPQVPLNGLTPTLSPRHRLKESPPCCTMNSVTAVGHRSPRSRPSDCQTVPSPALTR